MVEELLYNLYNILYVFYTFNVICTQMYQIYTAKENCTSKRVQKQIAVAGDRTRVTRVTGGNTHHYTTTTHLAKSLKFNTHKPV